MNDTAQDGETQERAILITIGGEHVRIVNVGQVLRFVVLKWECDCGNEHGADSRNID